MNSRTHCDSRNQSWIQESRNPTTLHFLGGRVKLVHALSNKVLEREWLAEEIGHLWNIQSVLPQDPEFPKHITKKFRKVGLKWDHTVQDELTLRLDGDIWFRIVSAPLLIPKSQASVRLLGWRRPCCNCVRLRPHRHLSTCTLRRIWSLGGLGEGSIQLECERS